MKKIKLYIFNSVDEGGMYGIGTYIDHIIHSLKHTDIDFTLVNLYSSQPLPEVIQKEGYQQIEIPAVRPSAAPVNHFNYLRDCCYALKNMIPVEEEYLFHLNYMTCEYLVLNLKKLFNCKIILTVHYTNWSFDLLGDLDLLRSLLAQNETELQHTWEKRIVKVIHADSRMIHGCDKVICIAQHSYDSVKELSGITDDKMYLVPNGLPDVYIEKTPEEKKELRNKYGLPECAPVFIFAGRLDRVKGIFFLLEAFKQYHAIHPEARLVVVGSGNSLLDCISSASPLWASITFTGRVNRDILYELYSISDIGIAPALHEEFGFVGVEMMMHGLPVIISDTSGPKDIVEDGVSGLKIPIIWNQGRREIDIPVIIRHMTHLVNDPIYAKKIGEQARKRFLEKYEISHFIKRMYEIYKEVSIEQ